MEVKTYRATTMHEALMLVRRELGPDAAVLHTREVRSSRLFGWIPGPRQIEVTASVDVNVPSRLPSRGHVGRAQAAAESIAPPSPPARRPPSQAGPELSDQVQGQLSDLQTMHCCVRWR